MKVFIMYEFKQGPYGGVNQFLKALKEYFSKIKVATNDLEEADIVLFNSSNATEEVLDAKRKYPNKVFVERIDGPTRLYNNMTDKRDLIAKVMNEYIADGTVFQTEYSRNANYKMGLNHNLYETTIMNAPNEMIFNKDYLKETKKDKIKLIATSWSSNPNKGFDTYKYLDQYLDFGRYEMYFVGNSPITFKNIIKVEPLPSNQLAELLKQCDIYITASQKDPCSNALIEAMFCGLPAIALRDGGHPEIVGSAGELYDKKEEIIFLLERIEEHYHQYVTNIQLKTINEIGKEYYRFFEKILTNSSYGKSKKVQKYKFCLIYVLLFTIKVSNRFNRVKEKFRR